jgi:hypothetical protein
MELRDLKIPISDDEGLDFGDRQFKTVNKLFRAFVNAQRGEEVKFVDGEIKALRFSPEGSDETYISRQGLADSLDYNEDYVSHQLGALKMEGNKLSVDVLEEVTDVYDTVYYRISKEKVAESVIQATENYYFELSETEKELVRNLVDEDFFHPQVYWEFRAGLYYTLLSAFVREISHIKDKLERLPEDVFSEKEEISEEEVYLKLIEKYEPFQA